MNASIDFDAIELAREGREFRTHQENSKRRAREQAMECDVAEEIRDLFTRGFNGEFVLLPIVRGDRLSTEAFEDAVWEGLNPANREQGMKQLLSRPPALSWHEAVIAAYIRENADDIARIRVELAQEYFA